MKPDLEGTRPLLMVFDMPDSPAFYRDASGFEIIGDSGQGDDSGWVWRGLTPN